MKKKKNLRSLGSIQNKFIMIIYMVAFPVLIASGVFMYLRNAQDITAGYTQQYQTAVAVLNDSLGYLEEDLLSIFTYVYVNKEVEQVLRSPTSLGEENPLFWKDLSPMNFVTDMINVKGNISTFILYPENGLYPYYTTIDSSVMEKNIFNIRALEIYRRAIMANGDPVWARIASGKSGLFEKNRFDKIIVAREIYDVPKNTRLGFMALSVDIAIYEQICQSSLIYPRDGIVLLDGNYKEIARAGLVDESVLAFITGNRLTDDIQEAEDKKTLIDGTYIFVAPRDTDGWILYLSPKSTWDAKTQEGLIQPFLLGFALLVSIWPISFVASRIISRPMLQLHTSMNKVKNGDFSQQVQVTGNDEIAELSETFNNMVRDMKEMIDRNYVMVLREKESELNALQAQINPHFLYNALDSLYWQAADAKQEALAENILALSELFRLVLSSGQSEISVRQEIDLISSYLHIQKMRFSKKLDYDVYIHEEIMDYTIPKLILQPFVENAIVHGLERQDRWGMVQVRGEMKDDMLHFVIMDNGAGMTTEKVDEILLDNKDEKYANQRVGYYAIRNVKERMRIRYGDTAALEIQSTLGSGTCVSIIIPTLKQG